jgi:thiamine pyrophosphate-dependent acetolactate synthase large subunit-like protein
MDWGSDVVAAVLRSLDLKYAALVPGASYRGLHDSIVNYLGNENPEMLLCLHEEHSVAIAHGYAKVTGKTMLAVVHSNVGLMHATMAIFNAWCDRAPVLILGANGPVDAMKRRPWIDWIHTSQDMGALVRSYTKWDDQPGSPGAAIESILRARQIAETAPNGPTFVVLDAAVQEQRLDAPLAIPSPEKFAVPHEAVPSKEDVEAVLKALRGAKHPVIIAGRCALSVESWNERVALAEAFNARVVTRTGAMFPTDHPLHAGMAGRPTAAKALRESDVILDLDVLDLGGVLKQAKIEGTPIVISCSVDRFIHNGWSMDYQMLPAVDLSIGAVPDTLVSALVAALGHPKPAAQRPHVSAAPSKNGNGAAAAGSIISIDAFSSEVARALDGVEACISRLPQGVDERYFTWRHPLDYLGGGGGGGLGGGPGIAVGVGLALRGTSRVPVAVTGDGDFLMGVTALWTAVASKIPLLVIVANNRSYFNDEVHQEHLAIARGRDPKRKWIGQRIDGPAPDLAGFARVQGAIGIGPIEARDGIGPAIAEGLKHVRDGKVCVVEVIVAAEYGEGKAAGITENEPAAATRGGNFTRG